MKPIELFEAGDFERKIPLEFFGGGPKSFEFCWTSIAETCSVLANAKLNDWLKSAVRVYGENELVQPMTWSELSIGNHTHQALLVCVEKIEKECVHEGVAFRHILSGCITHYECQKCHVKLQPTSWKAVE